MSLKNLFPAFVCIVMSLTVSAQVKIGSPAGAPNPAAVLELSDTARGFLLPRLTQAQMNAIATPPDGLMIFNSTFKNIYQYNQTALTWKPIVADSSEWFYDTASTKLFFRRALANSDSLYYNTGTKKWIFADTRFYRTSTGGVFNLDEGNSDRFIFKTTASKFVRPVTNLNSANLWSVYEIDNDTLAINNPFTASYYGFATQAAVTPQATQKIAEVYGISAAVGSAARDTVSVTYGVSSSVSLRGKGYHETVFGISNIIGIRDSTLTTGSVFGIQNRLTYSSPLGTPRIGGDYYGYYAVNSSTANNKVDGNAYGIFMGNVLMAGANRNFGIYTNKGVNHFGDSVLISDVASFRPRAVLDVFSTSAMIVPVGTTAQRPTTVYPGMLRYNSDNASPEAYTPTGWVGVKNPVITSTALLDPPLISNNATEIVNYTFTVQR